LGAAILRETRRFAGWVGQPWLMPCGIRQPSADKGKLLHLHTIQPLFSNLFQAHIQCRPDTVPGHLQTRVCTMATMPKPQPKKAPSKPGAKPAQK
tara:strand:+ start:4392 stop:4676 length:285 start_codon:yes stop_codon:yes gene_type:complete